MNFYSFLRFLFCLFLIATFSGCAGVSRIPLDKNSQSIPTVVKAKIIVPGDEIIIRAKPSNISLATGGGLIPALIDASITASRQSELEVISSPFYKDTASVEFRSIFGDEFKTAFNEQKVLTNLDLSLTNRAVSKGTLEEVRTKLSAGNAFMGIRVWYEFSSDARNVVIIANSFLTTSAKPEPIYRNTFFYVSTPVDASSPLSTWSKMEGKALKDVYSQSASSIAKMILMDLQAPSNEAIKASGTEKTKTKVTIPFYQPILFLPTGGHTPLSENGFIVEDSGSRKIIRGESGALYSIAN